MPTALLSPLSLVSFVAALAALLPRHVDRARAACGILLLALAAAATVLAPGDGPFTSLASRAALAQIPRETLLVDAVLALLGLTVLAGAGIGALRSAEPREAGPAMPVEPKLRRALLGGLLVLAAPTFWTLVIAVTLVAWLVSKPGWRRIALVLAAALPLAAVAWFAGQVGDTRDVWILRLADVPLSDAAQRGAVAPLVFTAAVWLAGALSSEPLRRSASWIGVVLLARTATALVPAGLEALSPVLYPLAVGAVAGAAWRRDADGAALLALAVGAIATRTPLVAAGLSIAAFGLGAVSATDRRDGWRSVAWIVATLAAMQALPDVLRTQVSWTLALLALLAVAALRSGRGRQRPR